MNTALAPEYISLGIILVILVVMVLRIRSLDKRIVYLEKFVQGLIAHATRPPPVAEARLIDGWKRRYSELAESPKKEAYKNRLIEVGAMDKEGNYIDGH